MLSNWSEPDQWHGIVITNRFAISIAHPNPKVRLTWVFWVKGRTLDYLHHTGQLPKRS